VERTGLVPKEAAVTFELTTSKFLQFLRTDGPLLGLYVRYSDTLRRDVSTVASK
jgi:hypothetical protein